MDLHEGMILERYKGAIEQQHHCARLARDAFATYAKFAAGIGAIAVTLISARESLGLDKTLMPDVLAILASLLVFLALVATAQIVVALIRWRRFRQVESEIDPEAPRLHVAWWAAEAAYFVLVAASAIVGWRVLDTLAQTVARG